MGDHPGSEGHPRADRRFLADSMVGKLARWLRLLGLDARYEGDLDDGELVELAARESRILLTRDRRLVERRRCTRWLLLESDDPWEQLGEVVRAYDLPVDGERCLSRCLECNVALDQVSRRSVSEDVPPYVFAKHDRFARCPECGQIYWRGTHVDDMWRRLQGLRERSEAAAGARASRGGSSATPAVAGVVAAGLAGLLLAGCGPAPADSRAPAPTRPPAESRAPAGDGGQQEDRFGSARRALIEELRDQGIEDENVLAALDRVPRHLFVPPNLQGLAYANQPLPIGEGQTISQPYIVALMTELLEVSAGTKVLEIGTGSGYQAAVLAELGCEVYTIEIIESLALQAIHHLTQIGHRDVNVRVGNGYLGWPEEAPFDRVIVTAAPEEVPQPLVDQLVVGGKMVVPVGPQWGEQYLMLLEKRDDGSVETQRVLPVRFVPMVGKVGAGDAR